MSSTTNARKSAYDTASSHSKVQSFGQDGVDPMFWGPYLAERQWATVREDKAKDGSCWKNLTYEDATKFAYKWGEDGLLGVSDKYGLLCASLALWNGRDSMLKERLFGLDNEEGNHGEDVKEMYYYLDNTPKHNYMRALYKYPHREFPYQALREHGRAPNEPEFKILETEIFENKRFWDVQVEYAKPNNFDLICKYTITNQSSKRVKLYIIPQFFFRNTWSKEKTHKKPKSVALAQSQSQTKPLTPLDSKSQTHLGYSESGLAVLPNFQYQNINAIGVMYDGGLFTINIAHSVNVVVQDLLFTNNDTMDISEPSQMSMKSDSNTALQFTNIGTKDAFHRYIIENDQTAIRIDKNGTKCCAYMTCELGAKDSATVYWQINPADSATGDINPKKLDQLIKAERTKADEFYKKVLPRGISSDEYNVCKQALAGLLWSKQFYHFNVEEKHSDQKYLHGSSHLSMKCVKKGQQWKNMTCQDILLVPDKWEFPWFSSWDTAFQAVIYSKLDLDFAKDQIRLLLSDRYMNQNGQIPGSEVDFAETQPPILAWAVWKIHQREKPWNLDFIKGLYPRLVINYQWWHKLDKTKTHLFGNGVLGLDNISVFDRSDLPSGINTVKQADATGWMGLLALMMLRLSLEQCRYDICLTDMTVRFLHDFLNIAKALNVGVEQGGLWHEEDGFYYDCVGVGGGKHKSEKSQPICLRSWTGIIPLLACGKINLKFSPMVKAYLMQCDRSYAPYVSKLNDNEFFLSLVPYNKLNRILKRVFCEDEFLSPFGIRSVSKIYEEQPFVFSYKGTDYTLNYQPGEAENKNRNWRGPVWMCLNYMLIEAMECYSELNEIFTQHLLIQYPSCHTEGRNEISFKAVATDLCQRLINLYAKNVEGIRPAMGVDEKYQEREWPNLVFFFDYFNAETGKGCGASHQTGWSALYVEFLRKLAPMRPNSRNSKKSQFFI